MSGATSERFCASRSGFAALQQAASTLTLSRWHGIHAVLCTAHYWAMLVRQNLYDGVEPVLGWHRA
jgi:hypothetical protein